MSVFIASHTQPFNEYYQTYQNCYSRFWQQEKLLISKGCIRKFDVRIRLVLGMEIKFNKDFAYTKTPDIETIYQLSLKLNEAWFAYESLLNVCEELQLVKYKTKGQQKTLVKTDPFESTQISILDLPKIIHFFNNYLREQLFNKSKSHEDLLNYLHYLMAHSSTGMSKALKKCLKCLQYKKILNFQEVLTIIYAIRNLYVHNGDAAKSGVKYYHTKLTLLCNAYDFLVLLCVQVAGAALLIYL